MAGVTLEYDDKSVLSALTALLAANADPEPLFYEIGEYLTIIHAQRFLDETSPDGVHWALLSPRYQARKKRNKDRILVLDGYLSGLLHYNVDPEGLSFGTDRPYGAAQQFGRPEINLPPRPWLGTSQPEDQHILSLAESYLAAALK